MSEEIKASVQPSWIHPVDVARYHSAARMIEDDLNEAYFTCRMKYGPEVAGVLLVALLRQQLNKDKNQWPPPDDLVEKVNEFLLKHGLMSEFC